MLTAALAFGAALTISFGAATGVPSAGDVICPENTQTCFVTAATPPSVRQGDEAETATSARRCVISATGETVPCERESFGWFNGTDECYYKLVTPQPPANDASWEGNYPDGAIYLVSCIDRLLPFGGTGGGWTWLPDAPAGFAAPSVTPEELAQRAIKAMRLAGPDIRLTIEGDEVGLVGVPVWLWTEVSPTTWGPTSATASVPGLSVTATGKARQIVWDLGDGRTETCADAGTPYVEGAITSPTCQHIYDQPSVDQPDEAYPVTATTTWDVTWSGGGVSGALTVTRDSRSSIRIGELQVLVT